jgi:hypothetical protein
MTDCFPDVVMPAHAPAEVPASDAPPQGAAPSKESPANEVLEVIEKNMNLEMDEGQIDIDDLSEEEIIPEPTRRRPKIPQEEIFTKELPKVKSILLPEEKEDPPIKMPKGRTKEGKGTRKPRGPATPEQLERLARGREKAKETMERKKLERQERLKKEKEDKLLVEKIREREREKLKKQLETPIEEELKPEPQVKIVETEKVVQTGYSQEQLDDAVARAVEQSVNRVEVLRKQRKEAKKKAEAKAEPRRKNISRG